MRVGQIAHRAYRVQYVVGDAHTDQRIRDQLRFQQAVGTINPLHHLGIRVRLVSLTTYTHNQIDALGNHAFWQRLQASDLHMLCIDIGELAAIDFV